jgi:uncharacterized protein (TIGR00725 family)
MNYYKICVSGAATTDTCKECALDLAKEVGKEIIRQKGILITGATTGIPYWSAIGAKEENGFSIGMSPAATEKEHVKKYHLPTDAFDMIVYTGFNYSGRNLLLTRSADAVIIICGRIGTLNEFTIAFEDDKPIGVLEGTGGTADEIKNLVQKLKKGPGKIVYDTDPKKLIEKVITLIDEEKGDLLGSSISEEAAKELQSTNQVKKVAL